jgi:hypothetical protein
MVFDAEQKLADRAAEREKKTEQERDEKKDRRTITASIVRNATI